MRFMRGAYPSGRLHIKLGDRVFSDTLDIEVAVRLYGGG